MYVQTGHPSVLAPQSKPLHPILSLKVLKGVVDFLVKQGKVEVPLPVGSFLVTIGYINLPRHPDCTDEITIAWIVGFITQNSVL